MHHDGGVSLYDWAKEDQVVSLRNNALHGHMVDAAQDCSVSWLDVDESSVCVQSINDTLTLLKHADAEERPLYS